MANLFNTPPHGSLNWGADRIRRLLDRKEPKGPRRRSSMDIVPLDADDVHRALEPENHFGGTAWGAQQFRRLMYQNDPSQRVLAAGDSAPSTSLPVASSTADSDDYGWLDLAADVWDGEEKEKEYLDYVAASAAISEMVGSQLPGREAGPADAYRHILWAAEMTRRFGEERAREMLSLHELEGDIQGQADDDTAMDRHNNEIGIKIGIGARTYDDVIHAARQVISGSVRDGGGWNPNYNLTSTMAPYAARWLPEERWRNNPKFDVPRHLAHAFPPRELPTRLTNWYSNPIRFNGPDWERGYVPDSYSYPYGSAQHVTGPEDPAMLRARDAYRFLTDRPWLVPLKSIMR